jgi:alanyl-tRNA synthetase
MHSRVVRQKFIDFFKAQGHTFVPSAPVVPVGDPTLLFTNAGMNQFKDIFLGTGTREYKRAVNTQKCIRVSGKHNDLEEVGHDTYHHTFFEMLGNWSFGDYYKKEAIAWAWELFTKIYGLPTDKLYATVYKTDDEAEGFWKTGTSIAHDHILRFAEKDNFWEMGETGPCGPCSEIHIDLGPDRCDKKDVPGHKCAVNGGCARFMELWNLVFIQYDRNADGSLTELPAKHVDTGAGLERITAVLQGKKGNYDTDLFQDIILETTRLCAIPYGHSERTDKAHRVIADHIRALTNAITDGASPSNEGRGYVMRRLLRRASRYGRNLNLHEPFLYKLVPAVIDTLGNVFPELKTNENYVTNIIKAEEMSFNNTLENGLIVFNNMLATLNMPNTIGKKLTAGTKYKSDETIQPGIFPGVQAFELYDTYGFPLDLTELMAKEKGLIINIDEFNHLMTQQKERARAAGMSATAKGIGGEVLREGKTYQEKQDMAKNHTATHLLHAALQKVLGKHATQAGSLVEPARLRFDFKHFQGMTPEEIEQVEDLVNTEIRNATPVEFIDTTLDKAKAMGAMSLFGEKYGNDVRVVKIGDFSMELCGGNHLKNIGEIGVFKITSEGAIAAGTRRIEAVTGNFVTAYFIDKDKKVTVEIKKLEDKAADLNIEITALGGKAPATADTYLNIPPLPVIVALTNIDTVKKLIAQKQEYLATLAELVKAQEKEIGRLKQAQAVAQTDRLLKNKQMLNKVPAVIESVDDYDIDMLRASAEKLLGQLCSGIVFLASKNNGKLTFLSRVSEDLVKKGYNAGLLAKTAAEITGGGGGGKADSAQAGGKNVEKLAEALERVRDKIISLK